MKIDRNSPVNVALLAFAARVVAQSVEEPRALARIALQQLEFKQWCATEFAEALDAGNIGKLGTLSEDFPSIVGA